MRAVCSGETPASRARRSSSMCRRVGTPRVLSSMTRSVSRRTRPARTSIMRRATAGSRASRARKSWRER
ncbi:hypothetical protein, partial [Delftia acidovorans]|uniref:hypothetical protein n=1 Tax=Delftia acidovorans TaxID=80866 RepID=UPI0035A02FAE